MEALTDLDAQLKRSLERYVGFLQQLLRILTERMCEHKAVRFFAQALGEAGCEVEVFEGGRIGEPTPEGLPLNVVFARRKGAGGGNSLLLGAHLDTVPTGDPRKWTHGPWSAEIQEGRIYARGAHDDRSGAAILYMVVDLLNQLSLRTAGDLGLLVTTEEEFSTGGMKAYLKRPGRMHPDAYLMVDGNRANSSIVAHGGALSFQIGIPGPSWHCPVALRCPRPQSHRVDEPCDSGTSGLRVSGARKVAGAGSRSALARADCCDH